MQKPPLRLEHLPIITYARVFRHRNILLPPGLLLNIVSNDLPTQHTLLMTHQLMLTTNHHLVGKGLLLTTNVTATVTVRIAVNGVDSR